MTSWETIDAIRKKCNDCDDIDTEIWLCQMIINTEDISEDDTAFYKHKIETKQELLKQNVIVLKYLVSKL